MKKSNFLKQWDDVTNSKLFEFEVLDLKRDEIDYLTFDIIISGNYFVSTHVALTEKQEKSKLIATTKTKIDFDFSLDENLQNHYDNCMNALLQSEFYQLTEI